MKVKEIEELKPLIIESSGDFEFNGVACDSRLVKAGDLFVAITGVKEDGARYIESALKRGAAGIVSENASGFYKSKYIKVSDARMALALLAGAVYSWPARKMDVFSVTGTNGKTTTVWLLGEMFKAAGRKTGLFTTVSIEYEGREIPSVRTTPPSSELQRLLSDMQRSGCDSVVMESSSHALVQKRVAGIPFAGGIFTNLSRDHLDYHKTMDEYFAAKLLMFRQIAVLNPSAPAVCCIDSEYGLKMAECVSQLSLKCITTGFSEDAQLRVTELHGSAAGSEFVIDGCECNALKVRTALAGRYNVENMLCAAAMAHASGVSWNDIKSVMESVTPKWGRLERVPLPNAPVTAFVDYAHTDDALKNVLPTLREITKGRLIVVFGCGGDRDTSKRPLMGKVCEELADEIVVTSDNPRTESPDVIIEQILSGITNKEHVAVFVDRREAIRNALKMAAPADVIVVAGKGHECFQEAAGRSVPFDDRKVLQEEAALL
ncbi:MAG: UDP-N-acetylmuramoyl-L-alanyl-D-glutamate--2,6-diaminopimelate ligase [Kiritimatiellae bacterium]|jgi:UDP-N-acetylmuramoyl-L-alanyl-D-glutamate--2,6-diaminopimelate ligase|nr:UDP-N-acetylmuramoyl-L-alanyl-D-glutamate--2,6-diaminopimelate ligase [Kiritimatiellia bacterium]